MIVDICGIPHKVIECEDNFNVDAHFGQIDYKDCEIRINKDLAEQAKKETICHEMVHGIFVHLGYNDYAQDEQLVQALGNAIYQSFEVKIGFWGNQDLKVPDFEVPCKQEPCEDKRLYIKVFADLEPDDIAEKIYQICDEDKFPKVIESLKEYFDSEPCNDCISRQTVLNTLFYKSDNNCEVVLNKELQDRIKALPSVAPTHKKGKWIPVSSGNLPENEQRVFVTMEDGRVEHIIWNKWWHEQKRYPTNKVIAWMPSPAPYEPQKREGKE